MRRFLVWRESESIQSGQIHEAEDVGDAVTDWVNEAIENGEKFETSRKHIIRAAEMLPTYRAVIRSVTITQKSEIEFESIDTPPEED